MTLNSHLHGIHVYIYEFRSRIVSTYSLYRYKSFRTRGIENEEC